MIWQFSLRMHVCTVQCTQYFDSILYLDQESSVTVKPAEGTKTVKLVHVNVVCQCFCILQNAQIFSLLMWKLI